MKEMVMKKIFAVVVSLMMLLMLSGVAMSAEPAAPAKQKPAKVAKQKPAEVKKQHLKKSELTQGYYVAVNGGLALLTDSDVSGAHKGSVSFDPGYAVNVAFGKRIDKSPIRVEGEIGYQKNDVKDVDNYSNKTGDMKAYTLLVNGYYDFVRGKKIVPYVIAGLGVAKVDAGVEKFAHVDDIGLAYQVGVGLTYHITDKWHIDLKYRYLGVTDIDGIKLTNMNPEFATNNVFMGLRYRF
jgi:opacity protein-like surface antigen